VIDRSFDIDPSERRNLQSMQATIVALYGEKSHDLSALLTQIQDAVEQTLGSRFRRYDIRQIHATLVGLERDELRAEGYLNRNFKIHRRVEVEMDFSSVMDYLRQVCRTPFQVQIGGFQDRDYPFTSRGERPFNRCFSIQGGNVVVIGWPRRGIPHTRLRSSTDTASEDATQYPNILHRIREGAQRHGVLHSYLRRPDDTDNDFFLRIGIVDDPGSVDSRASPLVYNATRGMLASLYPLVVNIGLPNMSLAFYESEELPLASTTAYALTDEHLDDAFIRHGYRAGATS